MERKEKKTIIKFRNQIKAAIRLNCYECNGNQTKTDCDIEHCHLYKYRPWNKKSVWPKA